MTDITEIMYQAIKAMVEKEGKYLTFTLAEEEYGWSVKFIDLINNQIKKGGEKNDRHN